MNSQLSHYETRTMTVLSTLLDPRFKLLTFTSEDIVNNAKKSLTNTVASEIHKIRSVETTNDVDEIRNEENQGSVEDDLLSFIDSRRSEQINVSPIVDANIIVK